MYLQNKLGTDNCNDTIRSQKTYLSLGIAYCRIYSLFILQERLNFWFENKLITSTTYHQTNYKLTVYCFIISIQRIKRLKEILVTKGRISKRHIYKQIAAHLKRVLKWRCWMTFHLFQTMSTKSLFFQQLIQLSFHQKNCICKIFNILVFI